jgi:hypothetical protein
MGSFMGLLYQYWYVYSKVFSFRIFRNTSRVTRKSMRFWLLPYGNSIQRKTKIVQITPNANLPAARSTRWGWSESCKLRRLPSTDEGSFAPGCSR